jgi:hypothetical protein
MKYMIYEDARTHKFAFLQLPNRFLEGDALPVAAIDRWFDSYEEAIAALPELFNHDESEDEPRVEAAVASEPVVMRPAVFKPH